MSITSFKFYLLLSAMLLAGPVLADASVYTAHCTVCHGPQGQGAAGIPNLSDTVWQYGGSRAEIERSISFGRRSVMPALGNALGEEGLQQVLDYVLSLSRDIDVSAENLAAGETLFMMFCGSCHGEQGHGTPALGAPDLTDGAWLYGSDPGIIRDVINNGRSNEMPGFGDTLSAAEIQQLAAFVQGLPQPESGKH